MLPLNESIVEDAALEWFGEQSRVARTLTPTLTPTRSQKERGKREAIRRLNPAIPGRRLPARITQTGGQLFGRIEWFKSKER